MGFFGKLVGIGLTAAAAVTAAKVAKKYMENKNDDTFDAEGVELDDIEAEEAEAAGETPEDGEPPLTSFEEKVYDAAEAARDTLDDVAQAAGDVLDEAREKAENAAESAGVDTDALGESFADAGRALAQAGKAVFAAGTAVAHKVAEEAPGVLDKVRAQTGEWFDQMKNAVNSASEPDAPDHEDPSAADGAGEASFGDGDDEDDDTML